MSAKRDALFPMGSVGRVHGARTPSRESLAVHPLLNNPDNAKYVPYTPRQRQPTTPTPIAPPQNQGSALAKPQLANLRAAAQSIGVDASSLGWAMLEKISYEGDEWSEIWIALTKTRAALLLPTEPSLHDAITPELIQDHIALCDSASTALVTLSGLRGRFAITADSVAHSDGITFRSTLPRATKPFQALWTPSVSRAASLDALPPLPAYPPESSYPSTPVLAFSSTLPLPARATKPPLPPRPGVRGAPAPSSARLSIASLFGQRPSTPPPLPPPASPTPAPTSEPDAPIDIAAFVIPAPLSRADIASAITTTLRAELAAALVAEPPWLIERIHTFALTYFPFVCVPAGKKKLQDIGGGANRVMYAVNEAGETPDEMAERFQTFYRAIEDELKSGPAQVEEETNAAPEERNEARIRDVLETIEATLCSLLYDRQVLFLPSTSDDASHNEALSSRIAALNILDLGLEHLDIDIGGANQAEVDAVVHACGQTLAQLDSSARSPREKAAVLVEAHKLVVEGLSKIPPIRLKSRHDADKVSVRQSTELVEHANTTSPVIVPFIQSPSIPTIQLSTPPDHTSTVKPATSLPPSPVSGDILLPLLIFSVVKANPSRLVSHLLFIQRFRNQSFGGEESYCLINLMAVAEFLENVDLGALGLGESEKKMPSTADLTPIPIARPNTSPTAATPMVRPGEEHLASLRGRVGQGVDAIAGSANKVISGVVDTSFGVLRALLPSQPASAVTMASGVGMVSASAGSVSGVGSHGLGSGTGVVSSPTSTGTSETDAALWGVRPSLGMLRRETGFSIAGLTVALPGGAGRGRGQNPEEECQRELVKVALRPASLGSHRSAREASEGSEHEHAEENAEDAEDEENESESEEGGEEEEEAPDTRSIKSFESMLSGGRTKRSKTPASGSAPTKTRRKRLTDLTDRLTHGMAGMSRRVLEGGDAQKAAAAWGRLPTPNRRFVECTEQEIRVSEVGELLREYQRLVEAVHSAGGFQE